MIYKEYELYVFLRDNFIPDLKKTKLTTSRYDCYSNEFNLDIELKCRRTHYESLIIEKKKYDALMDRARLLSTIPVYINSTPKGVWGFYLAEFNFKWEMKSLPMQTDFNKRRWVNKEISYLKISEGINLTELVRLS
tara:strand:- start:138 stop:545 length:408 start_codon:yes stop_codon:yes gene_type:complete